MKITVINTGGTFNKVYNPLTGNLDVPTGAKALETILQNTHNADIEVINILAKDSLDLTKEDRQTIVDTIKQSQNENIIIIHGTDTMDISANFIAYHTLNKKIILTGAMIPMSINPVEATMNFSLALGFLNAPIQNGVYIAMHGIVVSYEKIRKDKIQGKFLLND
jgi:L-asparaginase